MKQILSLLLPIALCLLVAVCASAEASADPGTREDLMDLNETALAGHVGEPMSTSDLAATSLRPYYGERVLSALQEGVGVRELTWRNESRTTKAWLRYVDGEWVCFDTLTWSDNIRF